MKSLFAFVQLWFVATQVPAQERQPFYFHVNSIIETLDYIGAPLSGDEVNAIRQLNTKSGSPSDVQRVLDKHVLFNVDINPESRVSVSQGKADATLWQSGWRTFLVKVENHAGVTATLEILSPQAQRTYDGGEKIHGMGHDHEGSHVTAEDVSDRWLDLEMYTQQPMKKMLSGISTEYFIVQLYSRDAGKRAAKFTVNCGQGTQDIGFRNEVSIFFDCLPAHNVVLDIKDEKNNSTTASLIIKDKLGHVYPSQMKRLAPDFFFQQQIYRGDGEQIALPGGEYTIDVGRGPEYLSETKKLTVSNEPEQHLIIRLQRWIDPSVYHWFSGDHHIHAAGCSHYTSPTEGVDPADMMRHVVGEGVNVGSVLTWGPGYYHQKQFFEGKDNRLSTAENLLRYDLEISGFPSSHAGHLVLLRLKNQDYPNTTVLEDWPTYTIPILKWAKEQNAITGYAHSGLGLGVKNNALPNFDMPDFDGIGANEYIVAVTDDLVDFISTMDTPPTWELNIWYHTLNCGFRTRISGETDFPCMSDDKVAHGRSYVKLENKLNFDEWAEGLRLGKTYVSEGKSHIIDFAVNNVVVGTNNSEVDLASSSSVHVTAKVAAYLPLQADPSVRPLNTAENVWIQKPFWNIERGRIGNTRNVTVELVVNGNAISKKEITADGSIQDVAFDVVIDQSSWVALRMLPSSHSNPIFVIINKKPIRANQKSAEWCLKAVDVCWNHKRNNIAIKERDAARKDYEHAKEVYRQRIKESVR